MLSITSNCLSAPTAMPSGSSSLTSTGASSSSSSSRFAKANPHGVSMESRSSFTFTISPSTTVMRDPSSTLMAACDGEEGRAVGEMRGGEAAPPTSAVFPLAPPTPPVLLLLLLAACVLSALWRWMACCASAAAMDAIRAALSRSRAAIDSTFLLNEPSLIACTFLYTYLFFVKKGKGVVRCACVRETLTASSHVDPSGNTTWTGAGLRESGVCKVRPK